MNSISQGDHTLQGCEIIIGVSGGIAAYKAADLVSKLVQGGAGVQVVMTEAAAHFVGAATFQALTGRHVATQILGDGKYPLGAHVQLAAAASLLCVAPATADYLAKAAQGHADDLLTTLTLAFPGPTLMAPAMNNDMWAKASVQRNVETLRADGVHFVGPGTGWLSCRQEGAGRMAEPLEILASMEAIWATEGN
ncbi:MAG: flavoprotein [Pirellulaceae bacterium]